MLKSPGAKQIHEFLLIRIIIFHVGLASCVMTLHLCLQLSVRGAVLRNAQILCTAEGQNQRKDRRQEEQTCRKTNALAEGLCLLVSAECMNHEQQDSADHSKSFFLTQSAQDHRNQEKPPVSPGNLESNIIPIKRNQRCPAVLTCLFKYDPVCHNQQYR